MKLRRLLLLALLLAATALAARAQVCSADNPLRRTLPVNVLDKQGNLVRGLTAAGFRGEFRGQPVKVLSLDRTTGSRRIVILLDASASMTDSRRKWDIASRAVADLVEAAPPASTLALIVFGSKIVAKAGPTQDRRVVTDQLAALGPDYKAPEGLRHTGLVDAMVEGVGPMPPAEVGDSMYVIGDGGENASRTRYGDMERQLFVSGIRLYAFGLFDPRVEPWVPLPRPLFSPPPNYRLQATAARTGGGWIDVEVFAVDERLKELGVATRQLYEQMGDFYRLEVELPQGSDKPRDWKLEVVDSRGKRRKDLEVVYPRKLAPCTTAAPPATAPTP